jgi:hypothetical protein
MTPIVEVGINRKGGSELDLEAGGKSDCGEV